MITYFYDWIENIAFYLVIVAAVLQLIPGETYKKYVRFFAGMILILLISVPILKLFNMEEFTLEEYKKELEIEVEQFGK